MASLGRELVDYRLVGVDGARGLLKFFGHVGHLQSYQPVEKWRYQTSARAAPSLGGVPTSQCTVTPFEPSR